MSRTKRIISVVLVATFALLPLHAQEWKLVEASELWLSGTSSVNSFQCEAMSMVFDYDAARDIEGSGFSLPGMALVVPVQDLDCDNRRMNRDMRNTMRADDHPEIRLEVHRIDLVPEPTSVITNQADLEQPPAPEIEVHGKMALAGVSRDIVIRVRGWLDESLRLHGTGTLAVKMTDFGMEPPTALFGLIKAHDDIRIRFHLVAESSGKLSQVLVSRSQIAGG